MRALERIPRRRVCWLISNLTREAHRYECGTITAGQLERSVLELVARGDGLALVLETLVRLLEAKLRPVRCLVGMVDDAAGTVRALGTAGLPRDAVRAIDGQPVDAVSLPSGTAIYSDAGPEGAGGRAGTAGLWSTPIVAQSGEVLGVVGLLYDTPREPTGRERRLVGLATHLAGIAIENHQDEQEAARQQQLYAEQAAECERNAQRQRLLFLSTASSQLAAAPDYKTGLAGLATMAVPCLADWCRVYLFDEEPELLAEAHRDPARLPALRQAHRELRPEEDERSPFHTVQRTGLSVVIPVVAEAANSGGPAVRLLHRLGVRSYLNVPIRGRDGRVLGAIDFSRHTDHRYGPADVLLAQEVARRAAAAVDNARLHGAKQEAIRARDLTLERLELEHALLDSLFTHAPIAVAILRGPDHVFALTNPYLNQLIGPRQVLGRPLATAIPEMAEQGFVPAMDQCLASGEPISVREARVLLDREGDGRLQELWLNCVCYPTRAPDGALDGLLFYGLDVTGAIAGRREVEAKTERIAQMNAELEQRVSERTAQLAAANRELESFTESVSDDLRAPLRAIHGYSQALLEECAGKLDSTGAGYVQRVSMASERMSHLIDALLNLCRLSQSSMESSELDLSGMAASIIEDLRSADPTRTVTCVIAPDLRAQGDALLMKVALENLLGNSWKFTARREQAHIEFGLAHAGRVFVVRDNGAGFDMAHADRLFGAFQRLHGPDEFEGTGIGLATVQRVIHRHGGIIWGEATVDGGATFCFTLGSQMDVPIAAGK